MIQQEAIEKCWAHSPLRAVLHCHSPGVAVARRLRIDVHDNDDNDDNAWQRGSLWPIEWAQLYVWYWHMHVICTFIFQTVKHYTVMKTLCPYLSPCKNWREKKLVTKCMILSNSLPAIIHILSTSDAISAWTGQCSFLALWHQKW